MTLTLQKARYFLDYNPETGNLIWKVNRRKVKTGTLAGSVSCSKGTRSWYRRVIVEGRIYLAHRLVWFIHYGYWPHYEIDHIDHNGLNNSITNLREATRSQNARNARLKINNTSGTNGVWWSRIQKKWKAHICVSGKEISLGSFHSQADACAARLNANAEYGYDIQHGLPICQ